MVCFLISFISFRLFYKVVCLEARSAGHWVKGKGKNMRKFFESFARDRGMDPLLPQTWYTTPQILITDTEVSVFFTSFI